MRRPLPALPGPLPSAVPVLVAPVHSVAERPHAPSVPVLLLSRGSQEAQVWLSRRPRPGVWDVPTVTTLTPQHAANPWHTVVTPAATVTPHPWLSQPIQP
jgi:hypothetical protein